MLSKSIFLPCELFHVQVSGFCLGTPTLSFMPCKLCDVQLLGFSPTTPSGGFNKPKKREKKVYFYMRIFF
jgi:hypothetical protein